MAVAGGTEDTLSSGDTDEPPYLKKKDDMGTGTEPVPNNRHCQHTVSICRRKDRFVSFNE